MSPDSNFSDLVFGVYGAGYVSAGSVIGGGGDYLCSVRPSFYLTSDVVITSGTGTSSDPYQITK